MTRCIELNLVCADACAFTEREIARDSDRAQKIALLCAKICGACLEECNRHRLRCCVACAEACRECARLCRQMAGLKKSKATEQCSTFDAAAALLARRTA
jgi:hypothetical protein